MASHFNPLPKLVSDPYFHYCNGVLHAENVPLDRLCKKLGSPLYVYSRAALRHAWQTYSNSINQDNILICYGMKANSTLAVLNEFKQLGAGFDIVSGGELKRVLAVGGDPAKVVFSGVGKQTWEIQAALQAGIKCFNVESESELFRLSQIANTLGIQAPVSLRVNPDVDAQTHPYISTGLKENKFGIAITSALAAYDLANKLPALKIVGIDCHIGSQLTEVSPYLDALNKLLNLVKQLQKNGMMIEHLDIGGGIGIRYKNETPIAPKELFNQVLKQMRLYGLEGMQLILEPGRSLVGNAGVLLTTVQYLKHTDTHHFAIVNAAMNDLLRPALYEAWHHVVPIITRAGQGQCYDVVGPVCESADWLARQRELTIEQGDVLAFESTGAYGMTMASNYNSRPRPAEVMVDKNKFYLVREAEKLEDLWKGESVLP